MSWGDTDILRYLQEFQVNLVIGGHHQRGQTIMGDYSRTKISPEASSLFAPRHMAESHNAALGGGQAEARPIIIDGGLDENYNPLPPLKGYGTSSRQPY